MAKETKTQNQEVVAEAISKTEVFLKNYGKIMIASVAAVVIIGLAYFLFHKFAYMPKVAEAQEQMYHAEANFRAQEYELALNGDGNVLGFAQVIEDYGSKAGQSVYLYAGVCELQLGKYNEAIGYLSKYKGKDSILAARALACIGDAYVGLGEYATAVGYFEKAASRADNIYAAAYLLKAGVTYEEMGQDEKALSMYKKIKDQYPQSMEGYDIDKYISRIQAK